MGQRLVLVFTQTIDNEERKVSIYQHWSGYTGSAIETSTEIVNALNNLMDDDEFRNKTPKEKFNIFVKELGTGQIVDGAYFTPESSDIYNNKYKNESEPNIQTLINPDNLNRNNGLIDLDEQADDSIGWAEMLNTYDMTHALKENEALEVSDLDFYFEIELDGDEKQLIESINVEKDKVRDVMDRGDILKLFQMLEFDLDEDSIKETMKESDPMSKILDNFDIVIVNSESDIYNVKNYESKGLYIKESGTYYSPSC